MAKKKASALALFGGPKALGGEKHLKSDWYGRVFICCGTDGPSEPDLKKQVEGMGVIVNSVDLDYNIQQKQRVVVFEVRVKPADVFDISTRMVAHFAKQPGVLQVKWC